MQEMPYLISLIFAHLRRLYYPHTINGEVIFVQYLLYLYPYSDKC